MMQTGVQALIAHSKNETQKKTISIFQNHSNPSKGFSPAGSTMITVDGTTKRVREKGLQEARLRRHMPVHTGRYAEAMRGKGEEPKDISTMHTLRIDNLPVTTPDELFRQEFGRFGPIGDVHRPVNKDKLQPLPFVFVRFLNRRDMIEALFALNGAVLNGREMKIREAVPGRFQLSTGGF